MTAEEAGIVIKQPGDLEAIPLNPDRGDAAPQASVLWGDIREDMASGTLLRFKDGFSSPPHIHNITYRAIVIEGDVHNAPPEEPQVWMGPGSFWAQAAGENHITEAKPGASALAFLEIQEGPYKVMPPEERFSSPDESVNLKAEDMEWTSVAGAGWADGDDAIEATSLWGSDEAGQPHGRLVRMGAGSSATITFADRALKAVVIDGSVEHSVEGVSDPVALGEGAYFSTNAAVPNSLNCTASSCLVYLRTE